MSSQPSSKPDDRRTLLGRQIGNIQIEALLGKGGMGEVYLGFDARLDRRVAIKTIRAENRFDEEMKSRFLREARILSKIDHPAICQVYDLVEGEDADYLIFEYVEGKTLKTLAANRRLAEREVLELGEKIADALAAAHRERIVHRDLKPENIMVLADGAIKILDFGISRGLKETGPAPLASRAAAPSTQPLEDDPGTTLAAEQDWNGVTVLLPGEISLPGDAAEPDRKTRPATPSLGANQGQLHAATEAAKPLMAGGPTPGFSAKTTLANTATLDADLTQLGSVIGTLRYMSPEQARGDEIAETSDLYSLGILLQELLTGESAYSANTNAELLLQVARGESRPVTGASADTSALIDRLKGLAPAWRPTAIETAERIRWILETPTRQRALRLRRRMAATAFAALTLVLVVVSILAFKARREAERANREAIRANQEAERANAEALRARQVADFVVALFQEASPEATRGRELTAREMVDRGAEEIGHRLAGQPLLRANFEDALGAIYWRLGRFDEAERHLESALATRSTHLGESPELAGSQAQMALLRNDQGRPEEAERLLLAALATMRSKKDPSKSLLVSDRGASILTALATLYSEQGRFEEAKPLLAEALAVHRQLFGEGSSEVAETLNNLAIIAWQSADFGQADQLYRQSLAIKEKLDGPDHPDVAALYNNLGILAREQGRLAEAENLNSRALAIADKSLGKDHPDTALIAASLGRTLVARGNDDAALPFFEQAYAANVKSRGPEHYETGRVLLQMAEIERRRQRWEKAAELLETATRIIQATVGEKHPSSIECLAARGRLELGRGQLAAARAAFDSAIALAVEVVGTDHPTTSALRKERDRIG